MRSSRSTSPVRTALSRALRATIAGIVFFGAASAHADDTEMRFEEYAELSAAARNAHERLENSPASQRTWLLEEAREADLAVLAWLEEFLVTDAFGALPEEQQILVLRDRARAGYNLAVVLLSLERCDEALAQVEFVLQRIELDELRPMLESVHEDAIECLRREPTLLIVDCTPHNAELLLDGESLGSAAIGHLVTREPHQLTLRADGYASETMTIEVAVTQSEVRVGPTRLLHLEETPGWPRWHEWTLWGVGAVGVGVGAGLIVSANRREAEIADIEAAGGMLLDPEGEQQHIDARRLGGVTSLTVGVLAVVAGTTLFLLRRRSPERPSEARSGWHIAGATTSFGWAF